MPVTLSIPNPPSQGSPKTIYHYTDQNGLLGIIQSKVLWVSSIRHLNDSAEITYALELAERSLKSSYEAGTTPWNDICDSALQFLNDFGKTERYVGSFSERRDLLSQWRAYTGAGAGFSIGFDFARLRELGTRQKFSLVPCIYDEPEQERAIKAVLDQSKDKLRKVLEKNDENTLLSDKNSVLALCGLSLLAVAPRLKHPSFAEEKEWRLIGTILRQNTEQHIPTSVRPGRSMLIPYQHFDLKESESVTPISEIVIGPAPHTELSVASVQHLLSANQMEDVPITNSSVPYRNW